MNTTREASPPLLFAEDMSEIRQRLTAGRYAPEGERPIRKNDNATPERRVWDTEARRLTATFRSDCAAACEAGGLPRAQAGAVIDLAWEYMHALGNNAVLVLVADLYALCRTC